MSFVLAMIVAIGGNNGPITSFTHEYATKEACENAKNFNRQGLDGSARVILLTCTPKG